jgi:predicted RecB family nuclease
MTITNDLVEAFLKCPTKCFLRSCGEAGAGNAYAAWVRTKNNVFRIEGTKRLVAGVAPEKCAIVTQAMGSPKPVQWQVGLDFAVQSQNLQCSCHAVEQIPSAGRGRTAQFIPIRFEFRNKLNRDDKLLLAFDTRVLSEVLNREVGLGKIVHGETYATLKVKTSALASDIHKLTAEIGTLLASPSPPDLVLNRHCAECEFQDCCRQKAIEKDDLSLLSGMTEKERTNFNRKGIFTVTQLSHTFRPRRRPQGSKDKRERYHHSLKALAIRKNKIHIIGSPEVKIEGTPVYVDIEGLPDRDFYYLIGIRLKAGDSVVHHSLWADSPSDEGSIWRDFLSKLIEVENPVLVHYGSFETVFFKRMRQRCRFRKF